MYAILDFLSSNLETVWTILSSVIVGASALSALIPGSGLVKKGLAILALNIKNATPEQIAKAKAAVETAKALTSKTAKK